MSRFWGRVPARSAAKVGMKGFSARCTYVFNDVQPLSLRAALAGRVDKSHGRIGLIGALIAGVGRSQAGRGRARHRVIDALAHRLARIGLKVEVGVGFAGEACARVTPWASADPVPLGHGVPVRHATELGVALVVGAGVLVGTLR